MASTESTRALQEAIWAGSLPLEIRLAPADCRIYDQADPYLVHVPRISYLPFLFPRLYAFFNTFLIDPASVKPCSGWFSFDTLPLKWHLPVGLLYDLFAGNSPAYAPAPSHLSGAGVGTGTGTGRGRSHSSSNLAAMDRFRPDLPWRLTVHYSDFPSDQLVPLDEDGKVLHDAYINSVKEADFLRNGTANAIMKLSMADSTAMWDAVKQHDLNAFSTVYNKLLPPISSLRHIPLRIYLPASTAPSAATAATPPTTIRPSSSRPATPRTATDQDTESPTSSPRPRSRALRREPASSSSPKRDLTPAPSTAAAAAAAFAAPPSPDLGGNATLAAPPPPPPPPLAPAHLRVVQSLVPPYLPNSNKVQTLGTALNSILPALFPSTRTPVLARPVLHGAVVPMAAVVEELMRGAAYADGWVSCGVEMMG